jgi:hypothetical protein
MKPIPYFRNDPVLVLVLGFITCGLYLIYWNIKMAKVINAVMEREVLSEPVAILSGCCGPLNLYYYYVAGQALPEIGRRIGNPHLEDKGVLLLILGFFFPMVSAMILQGHINEIYDRP